MLLLKWNTVHLYSNKQVDLLFMRVRRCWSCTWTDGWGLGHPPGAASSAARPAGLVCWASGSKDASPGRIRQDHPSTQYSRDQKSGTLYEGERERERCKVFLWMCWSRDVSQRSRRERSVFCTLEVKLGQGPPCLLQSHQEAVKTSWRHVWVGRQI